MLLVLLSMGCKRGIYCDILQMYNSIGGANLSTVVNARGVCIRNVGNGPLRFSKLGFYQTTEDAQSNQRELLDQSQSTVQLYTTGIANVHGSGIELEPSSSYVDISSVNNITLLPNTSIVIDFTTDVSFRVVRLGKLDKFTDPTACRLQLSTSSRYQKIADADFTVPKFMTFQSGDTQANAFLKADGSHVSPNGIFVVSTIAFREIRSITHTGTLPLNAAGTIKFTISPTPGSNSNVKVYYDTSSTSLSPTQCGTGTLTGSTATTSCTIKTSGIYYLYISLDIEANKISNSSTSGPVGPGMIIGLQTNPTGSVYSDSAGTTLVTTGNNVRLWKDLFGGRYDYVSNPSTPYPTYATIGGVNAIYFGNGGYLSTVNACFSSGMTNCSFEILVYLTSNAKSTFFVRQSPGFNTYDWIYAENGNVFWHQSNENGRMWNTGASAPLNSWQHYVIVSGSGIYRNGSKNASFPYSYSSVAVPDNQVIIGWDYYSNSYQYIAEFNVYSSAMTDAQVTTLYNMIKTKHNM